MNIPGFTAEAALYKGISLYQNTDYFSDPRLAFLPQVCDEDCFDLCESQQATICKNKPPQEKGRCFRRIQTICERRCGCWW